MTTGKLTEAQQTCGDVIDRLPCLRCMAKTLKDCPLSMYERSTATEIINNTPGLYGRLLAKRGAMQARAESKS